MLFPDITHDIDLKYCKLYAVYGKLDVEKNTPGKAGHDSWVWAKGFPVRMVREGVTVWI